MPFDGFRLVPFEERWESRLEELREFKREHGHCDVPSRHPGRLSNWVAIQRRARKEGANCMDASRIQKLEHEGFRWVVNEERWDGRLEEIRKFKKEHGHCDVPQRHPGGLGQWVNTQRSARKQGRKSLDARRIRKLEDEGFRWVVHRPPPEWLWDARLEELKEFKREHGHCNVPRSHPGGLGGWAMTQREAYKDGAEWLDSSRIQKLENEGFRWPGRDGVLDEERRDVKPEKLGEFEGENKHCNAPENRPGGAGIWVKDQPGRVADGSSRTAGAERPSFAKGGDACQDQVEGRKAPIKHFSDQEGLPNPRQGETKQRLSRIVSDHKAQAVDGPIQICQEGRESLINKYKGRPGVIQDAVEGLKSTLDKYKGRLKPMQEKLLREELKSVFEEVAESTLIIL